MTRITVAVASALLLCACEREPSCRFGDVEIIAEAVPGDSESRVAPYQNVALTRIGATELFAFTGGNGLEFVLQQRGVRRTSLLGDRCVSLTAVSFDEERASVVCTLPGDSGKDRAGEVVVYDVTVGTELLIQRRSTTASIGLAHAGVNAAFNPVTLELEVVFASGVIGRWDAIHLSMGAYGATASGKISRTISRGQPVFSAPAILFRGGERLIYFSEFVPERSVEVTGLAGTLLLQRTSAESLPERAARSVESLRVAASTPILPGEGALLFQDIRRPHTFPSLFLRAVSDDEAPSRRLMRGALTGSLPRAADCGDRLAVAMPRSFDGDSLVRVAFLDEEHEPWAPETEAYEYGGHLFAVDLYCDERETVLATSARYEVESKSARIYRVPIYCE